MKRLISILLILSLLCVLLTGCYQIDSSNPADYPGFYDKMAASCTSLPSPESIASIDDIYLYYSDHDLIDSYYTVYLECSFSDDTYEAEKQRVIDDAKQYDFALYNSESFSYESVYVNQCIEKDSDGFIAIQLSYALFDDSSRKIIFVDTFEEGTKSEWNTAYIPDEYLPKELYEIIFYTNSGT